MLHKNRIKLHIITSLIFLNIGFVSSVSAQRGATYPERNMRLGLAINPSYNWLHYDNDFSVEPKIGFSYGLLADFGFTNNYFFSTGLLINSINSRVETDNSLGYASRDLFLQYVEVPLSIKLKSSPNGTGRFYGSFGFTAGLRVSARERFTENDRRTNIDGADLFRLGLQIGTGYEWNLRDNLGFLTGISYNNGFTRAISYESPTTRFIMLNFGFLF